MAPSKTAKAPKGRTIPAQGIALGIPPCMDASPEGATNLSVIGNAWPLRPLGSYLREPLRNGHSAAATLDPQGIRTLTLTAVTKGDFSEKNTKITSADRQRVKDLWLEPGDILIQRSNAPDLVGTTRLYRGESNYAIFPDLMIRVRLNEEADPRFVELVLQSDPLRRYFKSRAKGMSGSMPKIDQNTIFEAPIPAMPIDEQHRIVAEIEKQFTRLDAGVAALRRAQANLKRYRAAVLKAACEGRLVLTEAKWKNIPLRDLIGKIGQGWSPKCDTTRDALPGEWAIITTTAVQSMRYIDNQGKPLPTSFKARPHLEIQEGDFLMTRKGPRKRAGITCLVRSTRTRLMVCDTVYRFRCNEARVFPGYLELALNSPSVVEAIDRQKSGINESGVSLTHDKLGAILIPLPPHVEQMRIVADMERRLSIVEGMEALVGANLMRATHLKQSILQSLLADCTK